jgi:uncharacterized cofD-like protein
VNKKSGEAAPFRIVAIGGGTGLSTLLRGLKDYAYPINPDDTPVDITAIVTVTDDGGSSGRLRRELEVLPPGDIRNCMVALSEDSGLLSRLFQYRFQAGRGLKGHSFGNLFLTALTDIMGDFPDAIRVSAEVLKIAGRIYPSTTSLVALEATLANGARVVGETRISRSKHRIETIRLVPRRVKPLRAALTAIAEADVITLGPGSLYTSVVPNLLVEGISGAIRRSLAVKAYFVNLMSQPGETTELTASEHVQAIHRHARGKLIDCAVVNVQPIAPSLKRRYAREQAKAVVPDVDEIFKMGIHVTCEDLLQQSEVVRHNPEVIARIVMRLALEGRARRRAHNKNKSQ